MKKTLTIGIMLLFIGASVVSGFDINPDDNPQSLNRGWLYVGGSGPGNYSTIQSAIDDTDPGDTVFVYSGTYYENVVVNKNHITLVGENKETTIIDGNNYSYLEVIGIAADWVTIRGFTVQNSGINSAGIGIHHHNNNTISGNIVKACYSGIYIQDHADSNVVIGNTVTSNDYAISVYYYSFYNIITGNNVTKNLWEGIGIYWSYTNVTNNIITETHWNGLYIDGAGTGQEQINVANNIITNNGGAGIYLINIHDSIISNNIISSNDYAGISCTGCFDNIITCNTINSNTDYGVELGSLGNNLLYHNNIISNSPENAYDTQVNTWDNGYPSGGNYWSDYTGVDNNGDGIGDTPYDIPGGSSQDRYPFISQNGWLNQAPNPPIIDGPTSGKANIAYQWNFTSTDPNNDKVFYQIDWGDGNVSVWFGAYPSGEPMSQSHAYNYRGRYTIKAKAKDINGNESDWGTLSVEMPCSFNTPFIRFWESLLERFPHAFPILRYLIGY